MTKEELKFKRELLSGLSNRHYQAFGTGIEKLYSKKRSIPETSPEDADFIEREEASAKLDAGDILYKGRDE